jgi:quercetin dioxygenase-like cupin family protein
MDVLMQGREGAEQLGQAVLLAALDDLAVTEYILEPGTEPGDPHYHANHTDSFYVIEGELEFHIDGRAIRAEAGTILVAPRGAVHAFPVAIGSQARFLNLHTPGGFERYLRKLNELRARGEKPDTEFLESHDSYNV